MTVYYVSTTGADTQAGTLGQPFGSLQHAYDIAQPGDEIQLRGGTYHLTKGIQLTRSGTSSQPITVTNYAGEVPILDGSAVTTTGNGGYVLDISGAAYNHISGLQITGGAEGGVMIRNNAHDNVIQGLDVSHNGRLSEWEGKGFSLFDTSYNNLLLNNDSHDNRDLRGDNADGFQIATTGAGNVLRGNRAYNNSDDGFDLFNVVNGTQSASVTLDGNWAFHNGYGDGNQRTGDGNGFKLGGQRPGTGTGSGGHIVTNNVAWDNAASGFDENQATIPLTLRNNTAYDNGTYNFGFYSLQNTLANNLSLGSGQVSSSGSNSNNSWNLSSPPATSAVQSLDAAIAEGPRAADGSLPASGFLVLNGSASASLGAAAATGAPAVSTTVDPAPTPTPVTAGTTVTPTTTQTDPVPVTVADPPTTPALTPTTPATTPAAASDTGTPTVGQGAAVDPVTLVTGDPNGYTAGSSAAALLRGSHGRGYRSHSGWQAVTDTNSQGVGMTNPVAATPTDPLQLLTEGGQGSCWSVSHHRSA